MSHNLQLMKRVEIVNCNMWKSEAEKRWRTNKIKGKAKQRNIEHKLTRNKYVWTWAVEEKKIEKDIMKKCKEEPKLFYGYTNGKIKQKIKYFI